MMVLDGAQHGSRIEVDGNVLHDGEHVISMYFFSPNSAQPTWSLLSSPEFTIDCTAGTIITVHLDQSGCDAGRVQQWTEDNTVWTLSAQTLSSRDNPIDRLRPTA